MDRDLHKPLHTPMSDRMLLVMLQAMKAITQVAAQWEELTNDPTGAKNTSKMMEGLTEKLNNFTKHFRTEDARYQQLALQEFINFTKAELEWCVNTPREETFRNKQNHLFLEFCKLQEELQRKHNQLYKRPNKDTQQQDSAVSSTQSTNPKRAKKEVHEEEETRKSPLRGKLREIQETTRAQVLDRLRESGQVRRQLLELHQEQERDIQRLSDDLQQRMSTFNKDMENKKKVLEEQQKTIQQEKEKHDRLRAKMNFGPTPYKPNPEPPSDEEHLQSLHILNEEKDNFFDEVKKNK